MRPITVGVGPPGTSNSICLSQAASAQTPLTLNGSLVAGGVAVVTPALQVSVASSNGADTGQVYVSGTDFSGTPHAETATMAAGALLTTARFATINRVVPLFSPIGNITVGTPVVPTTSAMVRLDEWADAPLAVQVVVSGSATFTVQHSFDDANDLVNPVVPASMFWDSSLIPAGAIAATAGVSFSMATAPLYLRLLLSAGTGSARMTITQYNVVEG